MEQFNILIEKPLDMRKKQQILNVLKTEIYPDSSFITVKVLEYPQRDKENELLNNSGTTPNINEDTNKSKSYKNRKTRSRKSLRYMTQPITLLEIRETDEDNIVSEQLTQNNEIRDEKCEKSVVVVSNENSSKDTLMEKILNGDPSLRNRPSNRRPARKFIDNIKLN
jgi:hypothetical protein